MYSVPAGIIIELSFFFQRKMAHDILKLSTDLKRRLTSSMRTKGKRKPRKANNETLLGYSITTIGCPKAMTRCGNEHSPHSEGKSVPVANH